MPKYWYDHEHLFATDAEATARFYETSFGARREAVTTMPDGGKNIELSLNGSRVLIRSTPPAGPTARPNGLDHFGIRTDNIEAAAEALKSAGVKFRDDVRQARPGMKIAFFWAPDNVLIELLERE